MSWIPWTKATVREPGKAPRPLCSPSGHYGCYNDRDTDEIRCSGCGQRWLPGPPYYLSPDPAQLELPFSTK